MLSPRCGAHGRSRSRQDGPYRSGAGHARERQVPTSDFVHDDVSVGRTGSELTAGEALWMQGQLRKVASLCATDRTQDQHEAARVLTEVLEMLRLHHHDS